MKRFESLQGCLGIRSEMHVQMFCVEKKRHCQITAEKNIYRVNTQRKR